MADIYLTVSEHVSEYLTKKYSTSFGMASSLFGSDIRSDIYNVYGFVRIADEIVDTYAGADSLKILDQFEQQTYQDLARGYSTNPVVHAFVHTCQKTGIGKDLIAPFIQSMRMDTVEHPYTTDKYKEYIYGSAEVVGLMCLKVFCKGDDAQYKVLAPGAQALGRAYQKVNFLRDIKDDYQRLGRYYFPVGTFESFDETIKAEIITDIRADFAAAHKAIVKLPANAQKAVTASYVYFTRLLDLVEKTPAADLRQRRVRLPDTIKLQLLLRVKLGLI